MSAEDAIRRALNCRAAMEEGRYCECAEPDLSGGLMCMACGLRNQAQERARVLRMVSAHDFVPDARMEFMCAVCSNFEDADRHLGVPAVGVCSWGESVAGAPFPPSTEPPIEDAGSGGVW